jgi:general secretion pathway protein M
MIAEIRSNTFVRRATFAAGHVAIALTAYWLWLTPLLDIFTDRDEQITKRSALLGRLEGVAAHETAVREMVRKAAAEFDRGEFLAGVNDGAVGAELQTRLKAIAEAGGTRLQSVQSMPVTQNRAVKYVGARIELIGTLAAIQRTIHALESGKPYLFVTAATLKSSSPVARPDQPLEPVIDAQLDVFGALSPEEGTAR